jgi:hypothetical protein
MRRFFEQPLGTGQTSLRRGLLGLLVAPVLAFIMMVPVPLFAVALGGPWQENR